MKIHAFKVYDRNGLTLSNIVDYINGLPLEDRFVNVGMHKIRLEEAKKTKSNGWYLNFSQARYYGPGRLSPENPIRDFDLEDFEDFGEETAAVYSDKCKALIVQYNHYGARFNNISSYLSYFCNVISNGKEDCGFNIIPIMQPGAIDKLDKMSFVKKFKCKIHIPHSDDGAVLNNKSLSDIIESDLVSYGDVLNLEISSSRGKEKKLPARVVRSAIKEIISSGIDVDVLQVDGSVDEDSPREPLDLLESRLEQNVSVPLGENRRLPLEERWSALVGIFKQWQHDGVLE
ncbi:hypothetical protein JCM25156A_03750 [Komagataeibacter kakiaceti JCM 25156]|uniref:DUF6731 family protein n=1 Tax=Komagataeibacter kakiaceti TaxID=943261 RepID=UPI0011DE0AD3|nr:DUF6731 family protein [Komagataeibacter kakiaceti]